MSDGRYETGESVGKKIVEVAHEFRTDRGSVYCYGADGAVKRKRHDGSEDAWDLTGFVDFEGAKEISNGLYKKDKRKIPRSNSVITILVKEVMMVEKLYKNQEKFMIRVGWW